MDHRMCFGNEALSSMMDETPSFLEKALRYMEETRMEIIRNFQLFLKDYEAQKQEIGDEQRRKKMRSIQMELLTKFRQREEQLLIESIAKLEKETEDTKRKIQEARNTESKKRLVNQIPVDLWTERRIRTPQMARKMMDKLEELKINLQKLQEELIIEVKEREKRSHIKENYQRELLTKFKEREELRQVKEKYLKELMIEVKEREKRSHIKENYQRELLTKFKEREELRQVKEKYLKELMTKIEEKKEICWLKEELHHELMKRFEERERLCRLKKACQHELMSYHRKKEDENECFVPRKLFLFNIDTFVCPPMPQCVEPQRPKKDAFIKPKDDGCQTGAPLSKARTNPGCRQSLRSRLRKFFGKK